MSRHRVFLGNSVIPNAGTDGTAVSAQELDMMVSLFIPAPTLTNAAHVEVAPEVGGTMQDLYIDGSQATLASGRTDLFNCGGFRTVRVISSGSEGAERTVPVYAILDLPA